MTTPRQTGDQTSPATQGGEQTNNAEPTRTKGQMTYKEIPRYLSFETSLKPAVPLF